MKQLNFKNDVVYILLCLCMLGQYACQKEAPSSDNPRSYIEAMVKAVGGVDRLHALKDVEYSYTYQADGKRDISLERYVFDGEKSWAKYSVREVYAMPNMEGEMTQGYDGNNSWCTINGEHLQDPQALKMADFTRKTNFYWFTMMFKLLDPGLNYNHKGTRAVDGINYDVIEIAFQENVGDAQDTYLLYINPETHLVDQFLFTVMDFGLAEPHLMKVQYEDIDGLKLPARRRYAPADWEGTVKEDKWAEEISGNIKFNNGFEAALFKMPLAEEMSSKN